MNNLCIFVILQSDFMRIITIGDLHGQTIWQKIKPAEFDHIIFIGDYVDSFFFTDEEIENNLNAIIQFKKEYPQKVILLWGNHDLSYLYRGNERHYSSGLRYSQLHELHMIFLINQDLFQAAFQIKNYLWTHAGIVQSWYDSWIKDVECPEDDNIASNLNILFKNYYLPLFHVSVMRGGKDKHGGIFWADSKETKADPLIGFHQIVGHTKTRAGIETLKFPIPETSITYVDCLDTKHELYSIKIDN